MSFIGGGNYTLIDSFDTSYNKSDISKKINDNLNKLLKNYNVTKKNKDKEKIQYIVDLIIGKNIEIFTSILKKKFEPYDNYNYLNINVTNLKQYNNETINIIINLFKVYIQRHVGVVTNREDIDTKFFLINEKYKNLLNDDIFYKSLFDFIIYQMDSDINIILCFLIVYTFTETNLLYKKEGNRFFPNYYKKFIFNTFIKHINNEKKYPIFNKDYYNELIKKPESYINNLYESDDIKLFNIIKHPVFWKKNNFKNASTQLTKEMLQNDIEKKEASAQITNSLQKGVEIGLSPMSQGHSSAISSSSAGPGGPSSHGSPKSATRRKSATTRTSPTGPGGPGGPSSHGSHKSATRPKSATTRISPTGPGGPPDVKVSKSEDSLSDVIDRLPIPQSTDFGSDIDNYKSLKAPSLKSDTANISHADIDSQVGSESISSITPILNSHSKGNNSLKERIDNFNKLVNAINNLDDLNYGHKWKKISCREINDYNYFCNNLNNYINEFKIHYIEIASNSKTELDNTKLESFKTNLDKKSDTNYEQFTTAKSWQSNFNNDYDFVLIKEFIKNYKIRSVSNDMILISKKNIYLAESVNVFYYLNLDTYTISINNQNIELTSQINNAISNNYGSIHFAKINGLDVVLKFSLCDDIQSNNYKFYRQSNEKESDILNKITKFVVNGINPNLPIIYKTMKLKLQKKGIKYFSNTYVSTLNKFFGILKYNYKNCKIKENIPSFNCSIVEVYKGDIWDYMFNELLDINSNLFPKLLSGFENIIISILSYWSVTKCIHNDSHIGNFLYKTDNTFNYHYYNICGEDFYIKNQGYTWTLWDYANSIPFTIENYLKNGNIEDNPYNDILKNDDIIKSLILYNMFFYHSSKINNICSVYNILHKKTIEIEKANIISLFIDNNYNKLFAINNNDISLNDEIFYIVIFVIYYIEEKTFKTSFDNYIYEYLNRDLYIKNLYGDETYNKLSKDDRTILLNIIEKLTYLINYKNIYPSYPYYYNKHFFENKKHKCNISDYNDNCILLSMFKVFFKELKLGTYFNYKNRYDKINSYIDKRFDKLLIVVKTEQFDSVKIFFNNILKKYTESGLKSYKEYVQTRIFRRYKSDIMNKLTYYFMPSYLFSKLINEFIYIYYLPNKKETLQSLEKNKVYSKKINIANKVCYNVTNILMNFKENSEVLEYIKSIKKFENISLFNNIRPPSSNTFNIDPYYICNGVNGWCWIKTDNSISSVSYRHKKFDVFLTKEEYALLIQSFVKKGDLILESEEIFKKNDNLKHTIHLLNNITPSDYASEYFIEFENSCYIPYNDIEYKLKQKLDIINNDLV
jgi:hypothetical protein